MKKAALIVLFAFITAVLSASHPEEKIYKNVRFGMNVSEVAVLTGAVKPEEKTKIPVLVKADVVYGLPCEVQFYFSEEGILRSVSIRFDSMQAEAIYDGLKKSFEEKYGIPVNMHEEGNLKTYMYVSGKLITGLAFTKEPDAIHLTVEYTQY